jgi:hypothetical protein
MGLCIHVAVFRKNQDRLTTLTDALAAFRETLGDDVEAHLMSVYKIERTINGAKINV